jgi:hypothetical protein
MLLHFLLDQLNFCKEAGKVKVKNELTFARVPRTNTFTCFTGRELP